MSAESDKATRFWKHLEPLQGALESYCRQCLYDPQAVEDVLQDALAAAYRDFDLFAEGTSFRAWMYRYLNLTVLAANRRGQHSSRGIDGAPEPLAEDDPALALDTSDLAALVESPEPVLDLCDEVLTGALRSLSELERSTLLLKSIGGFKYREIAEILGCPMGTVMSALSRARHRLRQELVEYGRQEGYLASNEDRNCIG